MENYSVHPAGCKPKSVYLCLDLQLGFSYYSLYSTLKASKKVALRQIINKQTLELMGTNKDILGKILPNF